MFFHLKKLVFITKTYKRESSSQNLNAGYFYTLRELIISDLQLVEQKI